MGLRNLIFILFIAIIFSTLIVAPPSPQPPQLQRRPKQQPPPQQPPPQQPPPQQPQQPKQQQPPPQQPQQPKQQQPPPSPQNGGGFNFNVPTANVCKGKKLGDGTQIRQESCSLTVMGQIPAVNNMISSLVLSPQNNQVIKCNQPFTVAVKVSNLATGFFSDPNNEYYVEGQTLQNGIIQGHSHVTIQKLNGNQSPDPQVFAFFKGLDNPANNGVLTVNVDNGIPEPGLYRLCTMTSSKTHQPVIMPVAQRGSQDDCIRFTIAD